MHKSAQIDEVETGFAPLSGIAFEQAQAKLFASGNSNICASQGVVYEISVGGTKRPIKKIDPPVPVDSDTPTRIR